jgi:hypothetical protein
MLLGEVLERFIQDAPMPVLFRLLLERALDPLELDRLFRDNASSQYTRELLFSSVVDLMAAVVCRLKPSVRRAYLDSAQVPVSLTAVYEKLKGTEPAVCRALVRDTARRLVDVVRPLPPARPASLPRYRVKVFDCNHLAGTEHRIPEAHDVKEAVLPGQTLVVYDPVLDLVLDAIPCEDAHAQERTLLAALLDGCAAGDLWVGDRNFSVAWFFRAVDRRGAFVLVRQHAAGVHVEPLGEFVTAGRSATGEVQEQPVRVVEMDGHGRPRRDERGRPLELAMRRVRVRLDRPTQDGDTEVLLLTNVPARDAGALVLADLYLQRWRVEHAFQTMTDVLRCELNTLAYPKAALLGFCVALVGFNVLSVARAALRSEHGAEAVEGRVSNYHVMCEVRETYKGMMIALPPASWAAFRAWPLAEFVALLCEVAARADLRKYPLSRRKPKPPGAKKLARRNTPGRHVATKRLLDQRKTKR